MRAGRAIVGASTQVARLPHLDGGETAFLRCSATSVERLTELGPRLAASSAPWLARDHHMSSATRASSDMRLWSHGGSNTMFTFDARHARDDADGIFDPERHFARRPDRPARSASCRS